MLNREQTSIKTKISIIVSLVVLVLIGAGVRHHSLKNVGARTASIDFTGGQDAVFGSVTTTNLYVSALTNLGGALTFTTANGTSITSTNAFFTNVSSTNATTTNLNVSGVTNLGNTTITSVTSTNLFVSGLTNLLKTPSTPTQTSTYKMTAAGTTLLRQDATSTINFSVSNATPTMYAYTKVSNAFISQTLECSIRATAASGINFKLTHGPTSDGSSGSTTIGTFNVQNQATGTTFTAYASIPQDDWLILQGFPPVSSTNVDYLSCALKGFLANN